MYDFCTLICAILDAIILGRLKYAGGFVDGCPSYSSLGGHVFSQCSFMKSSSSFLTPHGVHVSASLVDFPSWLFASLSASSFPGTPLCPGTHPASTLVFFSCAFLTFSDVAMTMCAEVVLLFLVFRYNAPCESLAMNTFVGLLLRVAAFFVA